MRLVHCSMALDYKRKPPISRCFWWGLFWARLSKLRALPVRLRSPEALCLFFILSAWFFRTAEWQMLHKCPSYWAPSDGQHCN